MVLTPVFLVSLFYHRNDLISILMLSLNMETRRDNSESIRLYIYVMSIYLYFFCQSRCVYVYLLYIYPSYLSVHCPSPLSAVFLRRLPLVGFLIIGHWLTAIRLTS